MYVFGQWEDTGVPRETGRTCKVHRGTLLLQGFTANHHIHLQRISESVCIQMFDLSGFQTKLLAAGMAGPSVEKTFEEKFPKSRKSCRKREKLTVGSVTQEYKT